MRLRVVSIEKDRRFNSCYHHIFNLYPTYTMKVYARHPIIFIPEPPSEEFIRNSYLSTIYRALTGQAQFMGKEEYLKFGGELHKRDLQPHLEKEILTEAQELMLEAMLDKLRSDAQWQNVKRGANLEIVDFVEIAGVRIRGTIDVDQFRVKHGDDLKSTSCTSEKQFLEASRKYGYFRQAWVYTQMKGYKSFGFTGIQKKEKDPKIFRFTVQDFKEYYQEGEEQARMLLEAFSTLYKLNP